jgi:outer membrane biosynthesis protein TonB
MTPRAAPKRESAHVWAAIGAALFAALGSATALAQDAAPPSAAPPADEPAVAPPAEGSADVAAPAPGAATPSAPPETTEQPTVAPGPPEDPTAPEADPKNAEAPTAPPPVPEEAAPSDTHQTEDAVDVSDLEAELTDASEASVSERTIDIYGFADFAYTHFVGGEVPARPSFSVGNLNLYLASNLGAGWRALAEVRFLYLPNGTQPIDDPTATRVDTTAVDYADLYRPLRWGGIEIERVWLEHTFHPLLTARGGQWLTPYGIWNVDHGSPVIIGTARPYIIGEGLFPERQTGIEAYGSSFVDATELGYHLTLSNGRGPIDAYADLDHNKALGGRLFLSNDSSLGVLTLGVSGFAGKYTDRATQLATDADGQLILSDPKTVQYDEISLAADLKWEYEGLHFQSEVIVQDVAYSDDARPEVPFDASGFAPDYRRWGGYALVGYRTRLLNIMPYVNAEYYSSYPGGFFGAIPAFWFGVNVRPTPSVVLKAQYLHAFPIETPGTFVGGDDFGTLSTQVAWSF